MDGDSHNPKMPDAAEFQALLDTAVDGIIVIDITGRILQFNPAAERLFGYFGVEVIGSDVGILMPEPDKARHGEYLERYLRTGEPHIIGIGREVLGERANGEVFPLYISVGDAGGGRFVGIVRDLSAEKAAQEETRALQSRLAEVGRFSLMGEMAAGLAHEINQPLSAITTYSQANERIITQNPIDIEGLADSCGKISEQALRAGQIVQNLRSFVRRDSPHKERLDVNQVVTDVFDLIQADARTEGIVVSADLAQNLPPVLGQAIQLQQVLLNLTHNAVDAMREGLQKHEGIQVRTEAVQNDTVRVIVTDHGHGVSPHLGDDVFHPFISTKPEGLGVGLAISKTIIQAHDGELYHKPNPAGGTVFGFSLPIDQEN